MITMTVTTAQKLPVPTLLFEYYSPAMEVATVYVDYPKSAFVKQYKLGEAGDRTDYIGPIEITSDTHIYIKYRSKEGIVSQTVGYPITIAEDEANPNSLCS